MNNMGNKAILVQAGDGTEIPEGMVGQVVEGTRATNLSLSTTLSSYTDVATITIGVGVWDISVYALSLFTVTGGRGALSLAITDNSNNVIRNVSGTGTSGVDICAASGGLVRNSSGEILKLRATISSDGAPTVSSPTIVATANNPAYIRAIRIA
jgi:hypothetical protein